MRGILMGAVLFMVATAAIAQGPGAMSAQTMKTFASSADVAAMMDKAKKERKPDQANYSQRILQLAPYNVNLEYRALVGPSSVHETEAEIFYVVDGSATLVTGGKLTGETRNNPTNLSGTGIDGGTTQKIAKGDFIIIPEKVPHWFSPINGLLVVMSLHVPRPLPEATH